MTKEAFEEMISRVEARYPKMVYIKPLVNPASENFGLEKEGRVLFPGCSIVSDLAYIDKNGISMYLIGIDERFVDESNRPLEEKNRLKKEIREEVAYLEYKTTYNILDPDDVEFWSKVKTFRADNDEYWKNITIKLENFGFALNMLKPEDRIKFHCIKGGGFPQIAPDIETGLMTPGKYKFYLEVPNDAAFVAKGRFAKNKAVSMFTDLYDNNEHQKLFYIVKCLHRSSATIRYEEWSIDRLYVEVDNWFSGVLTTCIYRDTEKLFNKFISLCNSSVRKIAIEAFVSDLVNMNHVVFRTSEQQFFSSDVNEMLGQTKEEMVSYISSESGYPKLMKLYEIYGKKYSFNANLLKPENLEGNNKTKENQNVNIENKTESKLDAGVLEETSVVEEGFQEDESSKINKSKNSLKKLLKNIQDK